MSQYLSAILRGAAAKSLYLISIGSGSSLARVYRRLLRTKIVSPIFIRAASRRISILYSKYTSLLGLSRPTPFWKREFPYTPTTSISCIWRPLVYTPLRSSLTYRSAYPRRYMRPMREKYNLFSHFVRYFIICAAVCVQEKRAQSRYKFALRLSHR